MAPKIAIVDDDPESRLLLQGHLDRYASETHRGFQVESYAQGSAFLQNWTQDVTVAFIDVLMPSINGVALAHLIREKDQEMVLVFVTNYVQYAIKGYEVNAFDYLVKPVEYPSFKRKFDRVWQFLEGKSSDLVALHAGKNLVFVAASRIAWCEASRKGVNVHLVDGEVRHSSDTMAHLEQALAAYRFLKPHRAFLVNPCHIEAIDGLTLRANGDEIPISKHRKTEVYAALANYLGSELP